MKKNTLTKSHIFKILVNFLFVAALLIPQILYAQSADNTSPVLSPTPATTPSDNKSTETVKKASKGPIAPPMRDVPGKKIDVSCGRIYVPDFYNPGQTGKTDLVFFFLGAAWCAEQNFYDAHKNAILVTTGNLKSEFGSFSEPDKLQKIIDEVLSTLKKEKITDKPLGKIVLSSFSGGYAAVREILKHEQYEKFISDIVLGDSLYCAKLKDNPEKLDPAGMEPFLKYAKKAADGKINFLFSQLYPPLKEHQGNTTTLTAAYLIENVGAEKKTASGKNSRNAELLYRADLKGFHVLGYSGMTTQDHFEHFYAISDLYKETSLENAKE